VSYNKLCATRHGPMLANRNDSHVGRSLIKYGEFSKGETDLFTSIVPREGLVVEVGANIGALTIPLARIAQCVLAIEPQRIPFQALCANLQINSLLNVWTLQAACSDTTGRTPVLDYDPRVAQNFGGARLPETAKHLNHVPLVRLDDVLSENELPLVFLKIDVEGMERAVMRGANVTIRRDHPILYFENDRAETYFENVRWVEETFGYRIFQHIPPLYTDDNYNGEAENIFIDATGEPIVSGNCIGVPHDSPLIPQLEAIAERIEVAA
jgi:FkbM family methyltransferase